VSGTTLEHTARRLAERGHDALLGRLRPAFAEAAARHSDVLTIEPDQLEEMVQHAAERADGLQWRRALASVAVEQLGISLSEALTHPAVARAQTITGAPSYEETVAKLFATAPSEARPSAPSATTWEGTPTATASASAIPAWAAPVPAPTPAPPVPATPAVPVAPAATPGAATLPAPTPAPSLPAAPTTPAGVGAIPQHQAPIPAGASAVPASEPAAPAFRIGASAAVGGEPEGRMAEPLADGEAEAAEARVVVLAAIHIGGVANLAPTESEIELRISPDGLEFVRSGQTFERLSWAQVRGVQVHDSRRLRRRGHGAQLLVRSELGEASFEIRGMTAKELRERLGPLLARR